MLCFASVQDTHKLQKAAEDGNKLVSFFYDPVLAMEW